MNYRDVERYVSSLLWELMLMSANYNTRRPVAELMCEISMQYLRRGDYN